MHDRVVIRWKLDGTGRDAPTRRSFTWPIYREYLDAILGALESMRDGARADDVVPLELKEGSAIPCTEIPRGALPGVRRLLRGPRADWTPQERYGVAPLYRLLQRDRWTLSAGQRGAGRLAVVPPPSPLLTARSTTTLYGTLRRLGGRSYKAGIETDDGDYVTTGRISEDEVRRWRALLGERVRARIECTTNLTTGEREFGRLYEMHPGPPRRVSRASLDALGAPLAEYHAGVDLQALIASERGSSMGEDDRASIAADPGPEAEE